jgi:hypothetical protein
MSTVITTQFAGQVNVRPALSRMITSESFATITTADFLQSYVQQGYVFNDGDFLATVYDSEGTATPQMFTVSISAGVITLIPSSSDVTLPVTANHIAIFSDTSGNLTDDATTAINGGNIQAGLSGTAGTLASFPATASKGSLKLVAVANTGDTVTTISNAAMGQATVLSIPDPVAATANIAVVNGALVNHNLVHASGVSGVLEDAGARIIANTTGTYGGGGTSNAFTATGLTSAAKGTAVIRTSTNSVAITKALPGTDTLTITFSADPGAATTVDYIYVTASQA